MFFDFFKNKGKLEPFEIKNSSAVLLLMAPGLYVYSVLIFYFNKKAIELPGLRETFAVVFFIAGIIPLVKKEWAKKYYGYVVFLVLFLFQHYLIYTTKVNDFSIDYLLGTFIVMFGAILILNNRGFIMVFSVFQLLHLTYWGFTSNINIVLESAILISTSTIFIFSTIILNGHVRYRKQLQEINLSLENRVKERTKDLEIRAKELSEKNEDLEEFAYVVSHDLKTPLGNLHALSEWMLESNVNDSGKNEHINMLRMMKDQVEQIDLLINGILDYSLKGNEMEVKKEIKVNNIVEQIIELNPVPNCIIKIKNKLPIIEYNETEIIQVFENLIENAIKHNDKEYICIEIGSKEEDKEYVFYVKDNGPGIEEKNHKKIFNLFQKLEETSSFQSIGLGLALVKKILKRRGGRIWLNNEEGQGTIFYFSVMKKQRA
ncbi:HAMP domain-containing histidine kinase [Tenacibaculum mesophilum]|uniref:histidine kinase n=1 Tax=Tenacibaculum mesophilum TaxID=104268 RepID=A0AAE9MNU9_9FLAO|nr:HAMP domain-containing sensor histidine kinase [Tenacibaculum mesophilum]UTD15173.1 HAMP domain-containing histidine kinase [Tenacibaculum mesophilum]GFD76586.1 hypothetical protein KUL113_60060 [Tenacibaculum sp. KUL113]